MTTIAPEFAKLQADRAALLKACKAAVSLANIAHSHWDADEDHRVGEILWALAGHSKGYRQDVDAIHAAIEKAEEGERATN